MNDLLITAALAGLAAFIWWWFGKKFLLLRFLEVIAFGIILFLIVLLNKGLGIIGGITADTMRVGVLLAVPAYYLTLLKKKTVFFWGPATALFLIALVIFSGSLFMSFNPLPLIAFPIFAYLAANALNRWRQF